ncbi:MAG: hypothetical protein OJF62_000285 [Pseudolabrys sp.]|jgi:capsular polysaccharide biosynthesis protein|nr:hypothetical protein [Pseudolabrys sp.]
MKITAVCDPIAFAERGYAVFIHRIEHPAVASDGGFTDLPSERFYTLQSYTPAADYVLRIASATIHFPNVVACGGTLLDANTAYTNLEHMRQDPEAMPLQRTANGFALPDDRTTFTATNAAYLSALPNYAAWLLGELPKIGLYRKFSPPNAPLLLHGTPRDFHFDSLAAYGITRDQLILVGADTPIAARNVLLASPGYFHHMPSPATIEFLRRTMAPANREDVRKIYVSRSRIRNRRIRNETLMEQHLRDRGYEIVFPESLSFRDQTTLFSRADVIIAPYGAALANLAFVKPDCKVMIVATKFTLEHARLLDMRGIPFFLFAIYRRNWLRYLVRRQHREYVTQYTVDLRRFTEAVDLLERTGAPGHDGAIFRSFRKLRRDAGQAMRRR